MPQNEFFFSLMNSRPSGQLKNYAKAIFPILHHLSTVILANATVVAFVQLRNCRFNFHRCTLREATPAQKSAPEVLAATFRDFLRERLRRAFNSRKPASLNCPISSLCSVQHVRGAIFSHKAQFLGTVCVPQEVTASPKCKPIDGGSMMLTGPATDSHRQVMASFGQPSTGLQR